MGSTSISSHIKAPRAAVYRALLDPQAVAAWRVPDGMTSTIDTFEPWEGALACRALTFLADFKDR